MKLKIFDDLVRYDALISYEPGIMAVEGATFLQDFGPWKTGQRVDFLHFDYEGGFAIEGDRKHQELRRVAIELKVMDCG
jgi:hypothetical protein